MQIHIQRKLRIICRSLIVTIPKQVCDLYGFKNSDIIKILTIGTN